MVQHWHAKNKTLACLIKKKINGSYRSGIKKRDNLFLFGK